MYDIAFLWLPWYGSGSQGFSMGIPLSQRAYAEHRRNRGLPGGTHRAVQKAIERQAIFPEPDGKIDPDRADLDWARNSEEPRGIPEPGVAAAVGRMVAAPPPPLEPAWIARPEPLPAPPTGLPVPVAEVPADRVAQIDEPAELAGPAPVAPVAPIEDARRPRGRPRSTPEPTPAQETAREAPAPTAASQAPTLPPELVAAERTRGTVAEASAELKRHQAAIAKLKLDELAGELVRADEVRRELDGLIITARNRLLGVAAGFRTRCPHVAPADVRILEAMIRDVLQDLADAAGAERAA